MKKIQLPENMSRSLHKFGFKLKKHSPEILLVTGIIGGVTSAVMACKATTKVDAILNKTKEDIDTIHYCSEQGYVEDPENPEIHHEYTAEDTKKDLTIIYAKTGVEFAKVYGPAVLLGVASIGCVLASHNIIKKRNAALAAAYTAVDKGFKAYRGRVVERFGEELDRELKYNIKTKEIEEKVVNEDGTETTVTKTISVADPNSYSPYSIIFDDGNIGWDEDPEVTKFFLVQQQNWANQLLKKQGHLFLNEVYDMLGAQRTKAGATVGWIYDEKEPMGDNFVDFGIFNIHQPKARDFVNGYEKVIVLDFNVDGNIYDLLP